MANKKYFPSEIEKKWQQKWKEEGIYKFAQSNDKKKYYTLVELPYPSGDLHIGHWFTFVVPDILSRFKSMQGYSVFFPIGYDAFGLPAENAAIKRNIHPQDWTLKNIETMTTQFETMGTMIDWDHVTVTCKPEYYKWNQWIFEKMYEKGIAYRGKKLSNWCPFDQTVLAAEHVENGKCWRCGTVVIQKEVEQWFLKITDYAEKLLWDKNGNGVDWPKSVMVAQNEWIGKKEGVKIKHQVIGMDLEFESFSAYPAWSWADRFIVIAPEHPIVKKLVEGTDREKPVLEFVAQMAQETELERKESKERLGVFTGRYAKDPFGGPDMPIWLANYALMNFGTGIIRCSSHDERDIEFSEKYGITTGQAVAPRENGQNATPHDGMGGILKDSGPFTGKDVDEVREEVMDWIEKEGIGKRFTNYHLHDWSVSRQRYWGTPVPMIHCDTDGIVPVPLEDLPVTLPYDVDYQPKGKAPLASNEEWMKVKCPKCGKDARRDPETLDTFFDSSWYYYRYIDPHYEKGPFEETKVKELMPLDIYFGGGEHTLGHTLYARFFTKFFKDLHMVDFDEFALKRVQHGIVLGPDGNKMSKSKGNVINPDDVVKEFGADATRVYLSFMMPYAATGPWATGAMYGMFRFLKRVWDLGEKVTNDYLLLTKNTTNGQSLMANSQLSRQDKVVMNKTIKKVGEDIGEIKLNTAVAEFMKWLNHLESKKSVSKDEYKNFLLILAPFAPHMSEELWQSMFGVHSAEVGAKSSRAAIEMDKPKQGENSASSPREDFMSIHQQPWPEVDPEFLVEDMTTIVVQINGKMRGAVVMPTSDVADKEKVIAAAQSEEKVSKHLEGMTAKNIIYVPGKILNFVL